MSEILSGLNSQLAATNSQIAKKGREIQALKVLIQEWFVEQKRIEGLLATAGITTSAGKKQQYVDGINNAKLKITQYTAGIDQRNIDIANLQNQKAAIQKNIDDYQEAVESSISQGIPEEGSTRRRTTRQKIKPSNFCRCWRCGCFSCDLVCF